MVIFKLALQNLLGAGLRTWLNVIVLSFAFFAIISLQGLLEGMNRQTARAMIDSYYGDGQYWSENYDPYDPLTLEDSHQPVPETLKKSFRLVKPHPCLSSPVRFTPTGESNRLLSMALTLNKKYFPFLRIFYAAPTVLFRRSLANEWPKAPVCSREIRLFCSGAT